MEKDSRLLTTWVASLGGVVYLLAATPVSGSASWVPVQHGYLAFATTITDAPLDSSPCVNHRPDASSPP